ncbi:hypothetical protein ACQQ2N_00780 [Dokdonella sp. MW10]|uniref:hypothetical protein n=1 Tax=Dokdonella sp. MW10 TaxID=2992926 RepID=UPI003F8225B5
MTPSVSRHRPHRRVTARVVALCMLLVVMSWQAIAAPTPHDVTRSRVATELAFEVGDQDLPPQRLADECTESCKRRRVGEGLGIATDVVDSPAAPAYAIWVSFDAPRVVDDTALPLAFRSPTHGGPSRPASLLSSCRRACPGRAPPSAPTTR